MNRKRRKAAKMFRRKYGKATNPFWVSQTTLTAARLGSDEFAASMRDAFARCVPPKPYG